MASQEYINISEQIKRIVGTDRNISKIYKYKITGKLNKEFTKYIYQDFKVMLKDFIEILDDNDLNNTPYFKKLYLYNQNDFIRCFINYGYELGTWLNKNKAITPENNKSYFNFPLFFRESCRRCGITNKYTKMDDKELLMTLGRYIDLKQEKSNYPRKDRKTIEDEITVVPHNRINTNPQYRRDNQNSLNLDIDDFGQGFGFDEIFITSGESLYRNVKVDDNDVFRLSRIDYKVMHETANEPNSDYFVFVRSNKKFCTYKFNKRNNTLVNTKDENDIYVIEPQISFNKSGNMKIEFLCKPKEKQKSLTLKNSNN